MMSGRVVRCENECCEHRIVLECDAYCDGTEPESIPVPACVGCGEQNYVAHHIAICATCVEVTRKTRGRMLVSDAQWYNAVACPALPSGECIALTAAEANSLASALEAMMRSWAGAYEKEWRRDVQVYQEAEVLRDRMRAHATKLIVEKAASDE